MNIKQINLMDEEDLLNAFESKTVKGMNIKLAQSLVKRIRENLDMMQKGFEITNRISTMQEFSDLIQGLYDISIDQCVDFNNVFSAALGQTYSSHLNRYVVKTYMTKQSLKIESETNKTNFKKVGVAYSVEHSDNFVRKERYTVEEITGLVKSGKIVITEELEEEPEISEKEEENYFEFTIHDNYKDLTWDNEFYPYILMFIRISLTNEKLREDMQKYLYNLDDAINTVLANLEDNQQLQQECIRQLNQSNVLVEQEELYKKLEEREKSGITLKKTIKKPESD